MHSKLFSVIAITLSTDNKLS